jgi:dolichol-phosphate mannosyltransferase
MRWKYPKWASFLPFAAVGASGMLIYVGLLTLLSWLAPWMAIWGQAIIAAVVAIAWNFGLDRWLAFWYAREGSVFKQFLGFLAICSVPVALNIWITICLAADAVVTPLAGLIGSLVGSAAGLLFNWLMSRWLVFKARF